MCTYMAVHMYVWSVFTRCRTCKQVVKYVFTVLAIQVYAGVAGCV